MFTRRTAIRRKTHTLTIVSVCCTLIYLSFYNRAVIQDFFADTQVDHYQPVNDVEKRNFKVNKGSLAGWSYERRRDTPETSLRRLAPQLFNALPEPFSPKMKNPCWNVPKKKPKHCLPYFYLIGMPKCGTTDLWNKLIRHPHIVDTKKEPHWWSRVRMGRGHTNHTKLNSDPNSYFARYARAISLYATDKGLNISKLVVGDGSASTMWDNRNWRSFYPNATHGPAHVNGELIVSVQPDARAIAILRDPSDRLYSDYLYFTNTSILTPQHFHERVRLSIERFHECTSKLDLRTCTYDTSNIKTYVRLEVGLYSVYVGDWLSFFPKKRLKIINMNDWHQNCFKTLAELYKFLSLEPLSLASIVKICDDEAENTRSPEKIRLGPMLPETKRLLDDFYAPYNRELARMLGDDRYLWKVRGSSEQSRP